MQEPRIFVNMKQDAHTLLSDLMELTHSIIERAEKYQSLPPEMLNWRQNETSWSILECLEHLNLYGDFYLKELDTRISNATKFRTNHTFKSGWLGNYSANMMLPVKGKQMKTMKTFKDKNPLHSDLSKTHLERFLKQQKRMLQLLEMARTANLNKVRVPTTLGKLIKFKLGDILRFVIYHNQRHILQAERVLAAQVAAVPA